MASEARVKEYLACWFQLGKAVVMDGGWVTILPQPVFQGDRYSPAFERCWQEIVLPNSDRCVLAGTQQTISELLSSAWAIDRCARCTMPAPQHERGMPPKTCPCADLPGWPNLDLPLPRVPADTQAHLGQIRDRLHLHHTPQPSGKPPTASKVEPSPGLPYAFNLQYHKQAQSQPALKLPALAYYPLPTAEPREADSDIPESASVESAADS